MLTTERGRHEQRLAGGAGQVLEPAGGDALHRLGHLAPPAAVRRWRAVPAHEEEGVPAGARASHSANPPLGDGSASAPVTEGDQRVCVVGVEPTELESAGTVAGQGCSRARRARRTAGAGPPGGSRGGPRGRRAPRSARDGSGRAGCGCPPNAGPRRRAARARAGPGPPHRPGQGLLHDEGAFPAVFHLVGAVVRCRRLGCGAGASRRPDAPPPTRRAGRTTATAVAHRRPGSTAPPQPATSSSRAAAGERARPRAGSCPCPGRRRRARPAPASRRRSGVQRLGDRCLLCVPTDHRPACPAGAAALRGPVHTCPGVAGTPVVAPLPASARRSAPPLPDEPPDAGSPDVRVADGPRPQPRPQGGRLAQHRLLQRAHLRPRVEAESSANSSR